MFGNSSVKSQQYRSRWLAQEVRGRDPQESRTVVAIIDGETKLRDLQELKLGRAVGSDEGNSPKPPKHAVWASIGMMARVVRSGGAQRLHKANASRFSVFERSASTTTGTPFTPSEFRQNNTTCTFTGDVYSPS